MSAPSYLTPVFDPAVPMTPEFRSDIAYRLAEGWTWKELAETLNCHPDDLRRATENDPEFAAAQEKAWARVIWDGEADGMRRLRVIANAGEGERARHAAEVLVKYACERRRNDTRLAIEKARAEAQIAVEKIKAEREATKVKTQEAESVVMPLQPAPEMEEERQKRFAREHAERAAKPEACVYLPDPSPLEATMPGESGAPEALAQCSPGAISEKMACISEPRPQGSGVGV